MFGGEYVTIDQDTANHMDTNLCEIDEKLQGAIQNSGYDYKRYSQLYLQLGLKNIFVFFTYQHWWDIERNQDTEPQKTVQSWLHTSENDQTLSYYIRWKRMSYIQ